MVDRWLACWVVLAWCTGAQAAGPRLVQRDLIIETRQTEEARDSAESYSTASPPLPHWEAQRVQVRNGEKAALRINETTPRQWTTAACGARATAGISNASAEAGVRRGLVLVEAGQSMQVQPSWQGGNKPVVLVLESQSAIADSADGNDLPKQSRSSLSTTITVPLGEWVTVASSGDVAPSGTYSSNPTKQVRRLLQVRVLAP